MLPLVELQKSPEHLHFRKNHLTLTIFTKIHTFCEINSKKSYAASRICSFLRHIFVKTYEEQIFLRKNSHNQIFSRNFLRKQIFSRKSSKISFYLNTFTKMVPRFHVRRDKLCLFVMNLRKTKHLLLFAKIFPKMQKQTFLFQS
jgi:hypothetical protein